MIELIFRLLFAHAICDFALQSDMMAKGKNRNFNPDYIPKGQKYCPCWPYWLTAHALIAGLGVYWATGLVVFGVVEIINHWIIDFLKCDNKLNPNQDQGLHLFCRLLYFISIFTIVGF